MKKELFRSLDDDGLRRWLEQFPDVRPEQGPRPEWSPLRVKPGKGGNYSPGLLPPDPDLAQRIGPWGKQGLRSAGRLARGLRGLTPLGKLLELTEQLEGLRNGSNGFTPNLRFDNFVKCDGPYGPNVLNPSGKIYFMGNYVDCVQRQLAGQGLQANGAFAYVQDLKLGQSTTIRYSGGYTSSPGTMFIAYGYYRGTPEYGIEHSSWTRIRNAPWTYTNVGHPIPAEATPAITPAPNPNIIRTIPANRPYTDIPVLEPFAEPEPIIKPPTPEEIIQATRPWAFDVTPTRSTSPSPVRSPATTPGGSVPVDTVGRNPPATGERERKMMSKSVKVAVALYKALDKVSEAAEVVDAFYDALPDDVKKKWGCGKIKGRGLADTAGQYGIDKADCKGKALYHNWHKVDMEDAIKNIIANHINDKIIGGYKRKLPKNIGNAVSQGDKAVAKGLDWSWDQLWSALGMD